MKRYILITIVLLISQITFTYGQFNADAGPDKVVCVGMYGIDTIQIGGNPTAFGGTPPYTYTWEGSYTFSNGSYSYTLTASDFLNDTTIANPLVVYQSLDFVDTVEFHLTVHDAIGSFCYDSVIIHYSMLMMTMQVYLFDIQQGDSIYLNYGINAWSTFPTTEYLWRPNNGLIDSTNLSFWAKPEYSVHYYPTITDSAGCVFPAEDFYWINVNPVSTNETEQEEFNILGKPNPASDFIRLTIENGNEREKYNMIIINTSGQLVKKLEFGHGIKSLQINVSGWRSGNYSAIVSTNGIMVGNYKFIVQ